MYSLTSKLVVVLAGEELLIVLIEVGKLVHEIDRLLHLLFDFKGDGTWGAGVQHREALRYLLVVGHRVFGEGHRGYQDPDARSQQQEAGQAGLQDRRADVGRRPPLSKHYVLALLRMFLGLHRGGCTNIVK